MKTLAAAALAALCLGGCINTTVRWRPQTVPGGYRPCVKVGQSRDDKIDENKGLYCKNYTVVTQPDKEGR